MTLQTVWFIVIGILFTSYAILDGFDLGVGAWHLFVKRDEERRTLLNAIGPVWDGHEVWLVAAGGSLFAAFPEAYATAFSGFYVAFMLFLLAVIARAVSIEFRSRQPMLRWRQVWDTGFSAGSLLIALLAGVALGNLIVGVPLASDHEYAGTFLSMLRPYPLLVGLTTVALFMMHGAIYLVLKTEGELHERFRRYARKGHLAFVVVYSVTTIATFLRVPRMVEPMQAHPVLAGLVFLILLAIANVAWQLRRGRPEMAFVSSSAVIALLLALFGVGIFPNLLLSDPSPENSLTITNAASSPKTQQIILVVAAVGISLMLAYTATVHWIFRGKVRLDRTSY
jgi:cytochrome d ubiquinol oxidase subunit II